MLKQDARSPYMTALVLIAVGGGLVLWAVKHGRDFPQTDTPVDA
ncbi:MAG: hypothetical protein QM811_15710 [Pirellulales bacterium]